VITGEGGNEHAQESIMLERNKQKKGSPRMKAMSVAKFQEIKEYISDPEKVRINATIDPVGYARMLADFCEVLIEEIEGMRSSSDNHAM
jgi:hypothetical protein